MTVENQCSASPLYAVIDLGSNSFHMLITRLVADSVQTVDKVKRKVRLASGLDKDNLLSEQAILRGLECLSFFAERLQDIAPEHIRIVATATLRIAKNAQDFLVRAEQVLGHKVVLLSGEEEAQRIYLGVAHTSEGAERRLVLDIGGASTEVVVGGAFDMDNAVSIDMGCVTFNNMFFHDGLLTSKNFSAAISHAKQLLAPIKNEFLALGWNKVVGGSGTMQALAELLMSRNQAAIITYDFLTELRNSLEHCQTIDGINIKGLLSERTPVIASGLSILIALFETLKIERLQLSSGALREGLLYEMLPDMRQVSIRSRTINSLCQRFHVDLHHANRVKKQAQKLLDSHATDWELEHNNIQQLLLASCVLHEVGLLLSYKYHAQHSAYILKHADLPGFDQAERQLLVLLVQYYKGDIDPEALTEISLVSEKIIYRLLIIVRLSAVLCRRRRDDVLPDYHTRVSDSSIELCLPENWLSTHPLLADELLQENNQLAKLGYYLAIQC